MGFGLFNQKKHRQSAPIRSLAARFGIAAGVASWCALISSCSPLVELDLNPLDSPSQSWTASLDERVLVPLSSRKPTAEDQEEQNQLPRFARRSEGAVSTLLFETEPRLNFDPFPPVTHFELENNWTNVLEFLVAQGLDPEQIRQSQRVQVAAFDNVPWNLNEIKVIDQRKAIYLAIMLPLAAQVNQEIKTERQRLLDLRLRGWVKQHNDPWLQDLAKKYYAETRTIDELISRVAPIPIDMMLAQSIEESGWGTSRFALQINALFGERVFGKNGNGLTPFDKDEKIEFKVKAFDSLKHSVERYALNLNRHRLYSKMRLTRSELAENKRPVTGKDLMPTLTAYSTNRETYIRKIIEIIDDNALYEFNDLRLDQSNPMTIGFTEPSYTLYEAALKARRLGS